MIFNHYSTAFLLHKTSYNPSFKPLYASSTATSVDTVYTYLMELAHRRIRKPLSHAAIADFVHNRTTTPPTNLTKPETQYLLTWLSYAGDFAAKKASEHDFTDALTECWQKMQVCDLRPRENTVSTFLYVLQDHPMATQVAAYHAEHFAPNEKVATIQIPNLLSQDLADEALELARSIVPRLRTLKPVLEWWCEHGQVEDALQLLREMQTYDTVLIDDESYCRVLNLVDDAQIQQELLQEMATDLMEVSEACLDYLEGTKVTLSSEGKCPMTGVTLQLLPLLPDQRIDVYHNLVHMAMESHEEYTKSLKKGGSTSAVNATRALEAFGAWLPDNTTIVIDGANVGYHGKGYIQYSNLRKAVDFLKDDDSNIVIVMPHKYMQPVFWLTSKQQRQVVSEADRQLLETLRPYIYTVPSKCLDDYYWMIASVCGTTSNIRLITNDLMRDHRLQLMDPRLFRRWTSCHIQGYDFVVSTDDSDDKEFCLLERPVYSREMQVHDKTWHLPVTEWQDDERFCIVLD